MSADGRVGCPGAGRLPASECSPWPLDYPRGKRPCPRCGGLYALRADGRIRAHRVHPADIVPMIGGVRAAYNEIHSMRRR